jgi:hypothetical protein
MRKAEIRSERIAKREIDLAERRSSLYLMLYADSNKSMGKNTYKRISGVS